jgi:5,10-methylenetetrahydrofolate reductase
MSNAVMRMSSLGAAMILQTQGMETVVQVCCRDRNRIALQADLLAASGCGVDNIMVVTGKDPSYGDHHKARSVYDIDIFELLQTVGDLQNGRDMAGIDLSGSPEFTVGSTVNAAARDKSPELELEEMNRKIADIAPFMKRIDRQKAVIIPTVLLLKSMGMARYIARNMEGVHIPDELIQRIRKAPDKVRECVRIAAELVTTLKREGFDGVLLATLGWEHKLPEILSLT